MYTIYTRDGCGFCDMAKQIMKENNILYKEINIWEDADGMKFMKENDSGSIINISSVEGHKPDKGLGVYSISKAAISMLTKSQAKEWGKYGIRSNAICPGLIKTKLSSAL